LELIVVKVKVPVENMLGKENEGIKVIREFPRCACEDIH
jgi:alkylation response protein AidB-like acyl-CoA dehydrogenase